MLISDQTPWCGLEAEGVGHEAMLSAFRPEYVINCIGAVTQRA